MSDGARGRDLSRESREELEARAAYYERRADAAAEYFVRADEQLSLTRRELTQRTLAFTILSQLQGTVAVDAHEDMGSVFDLTLKLIHEVLKVDRSVILLQRDGQPGIYEAVHHLGLDPEVVDRLPALFFSLSPDQLGGRDHLIANRAAERTPVVELLRHMLGVRYFILAPLRTSEGIYGYLLSANDKEAYPFYPPFNEGHLDTFSSIAGFLSASYTNFGLVRDLTEAKERLERYSSDLERMVAERTADLDRKNRQLVEEKEKSEELLLNILPRETAVELRTTGQALARSFDEVTVVFADIAGFSRASREMEAEELVGELDQIFRAFDHIVHRHGLEKLKTIGDCYMFAGGIPVQREGHAVDAVRACLEANTYMAKKTEAQERRGLPTFAFRFGIHTGPVVAGVVGSRKFAYDIWGETVNLASFMEAYGETGRIHVSGTTWERIRHRFEGTPRGPVRVKHDLEVETYFVDRERPAE